MRKVSANLPRTRAIVPASIHDTQIAIAVLARGTYLCIQTCLSYAAIRIRSRIGALLCGRGRSRLIFSRNRRHSR